MLYLVSLCLLWSSVWAKDGINIQVIQGDRSYIASSNVDTSFSSLMRRSVHIPRQGITGVHYVKDRRAVYLRSSLLVQDDTGDSTVTFLRPGIGDQMSRLEIRKADLIHVTYDRYALPLKSGEPQEEVGLWEGRTQRQPAWIILGLVGMGIGAYEALEWQQLNPAHTRSLPAGYRLRPGYEAYETHRWQERDLARQQRKLKVAMAVAAVAGLSGILSFIEGATTDPQIMLGNGVVLSCRF